MLSLHSSIYGKAHSVAWIAPDGEFIQIDKGQNHDDYSSQFPGVESRERYPSNAAIELGYAKVSNPFEILLTDVERGDARLETMAAFTSDAIVAFDKSKSLPAWLEVSQNDRSLPLTWPFRLTAPGRQLSFNRMTVGEFIGDYGSNETLEHIMNHFDGRMNERLLRVFIRKMLLS